ncbi:FadR/GntR family transcriptional regulator [Arthrobacter bambusae]|uniref:FadR/GntR family transcriptional regulator n=1 Tax=Arthrobacter bambusae TaxID=1338426 RepID=UPI00277D2B4F|nr:GntR family transcriptional regulator [Arthrobacter bambusae]MDQ0029942.1 DNA-binding FadR family transcriptional regulator [Arthrobacter bambusae]MDQ0097540.1 DNA-binding FadR family transcriptional regulator [Arthrobacter bambusae]
MTHNTWTQFLDQIGPAGISEAIVRRLTELIASGEIPSGARLPSEQELAARFDVAPMTVRAALQSLRSNGLVETRRGRHAGTYVQSDVVAAISAGAEPKPTAYEFADFITWRIAVSGEAVARAAKRITSEQIPRLHHLQEIADGGNLTDHEYRLADARLHLALAELSDSRRLLDAERQIQASMTEWLGNLGAPDLESFPGAGHSQLIQAVCAGDSVLARERLREHAVVTLEGTSKLGWFSIRHEGEAGTNRSAAPTP